MFNFKNVGKEIKGWAKALAIIVFIPFIIGGVVMVFGALATLTDIEYFGDFIACLGMLIGAALVVGLGYLVARLSAIMLYGFGELIDKVMNISDRVDNMEAKICQVAPSAAASVAPTAPRPVGNIVVDSTGDGTSDR